MIPTAPQPASINNMPREFAPGDCPMCFPNVCVGGAHYMALYEDGITTQVQYIAIVEKEKQMNLGPRCNFMLPNHCQCPNTALVDSDMCELHKEFQTEQAVAVEQAKIQKLEK